MKVIATVGHVERKPRAKGGKGGPGRGKKTAPEEWRNSKGIRAKKRKARMDMKAKKAVSKRKAARLAARQAREQILLEARDLLLPVNTHYEYSHNSLF